MGLGISAHLFKKEGTEIRGAQEHRNGGENLETIETNLR